MTNARSIVSAPSVEPASLPWAARAKSLVGSIIDSSTSLLQEQTHDIVSFAMRRFPWQDSLATHCVYALPRKPLSGRNSALPDSPKHSKCGRSERRGVNDKAVPHRTVNDSVKSLGYFAGRNHLHLGAEPMGGAEVQHFLRLPDAAHL